MALESQGFKLEMAGNDGGAETITAMTLSNPTILTSVAHALVNGDVITLANFAGDDAATLNDKVVVVSNVTDDTFAVDIDTTGLTITDNTDAATATPKAWTEIGEITDVNREDPGASEIDSTHLQSTMKEYLMGLEDGGTYSFSVNWLFDDAGQTALLAAKKARTKQTFRATYSDDSTISLDAFVKTFSGPNASVDGKLTGNVVLKISGDYTIA